MATIRVCDWTKKQIATTAQTVKLMVGSRAYEISEAAATEMIGRLESDVVPPQAAPLQVVNGPAARHVAEPDIGINIETEGDPFEGDPEQEPMGEPVKLPVPAANPLPIPESIKQKLPLPSPAQADQVVAESTKFKEGTLKTLTPGKNRNLAQQRLAAREAKFEDNKRPVPRIGRDEE